MTYLETTNPLPYHSHYESTSQGPKYNLSYTKQGSLLLYHVLGSATQSSSEVTIANLFSQPKVSDTYMTISSKKNILWLQISVDNTCSTNLRQGDEQYPNYKHTFVVEKFNSNNHLSQVEKDLLLQNDTSSSQMIEKLATREKVHH